MGLSGARRRITMRLQRRWLQGRALVKGWSLRAVSDRTDGMPDGPVVFSTMRNEVVRLPWFLDYYRDLGVVHFVVVDNGSDDGTVDLLTAQPDVSVWTARGSYKRARFGVDWLNHLLRRHGHGRWVLVVDPDELLVYPHHDTRKLPALTRWLDEQGEASLGVLLLDMYGEGPVSQTRLGPGEDPVKVAPWFDAGNYAVGREPQYRNLWIQGGPRMRAFFADDPNLAPALNKTPLVRWHRGYVYKTGAHDLLPRGLNVTYATTGGAKTSGVLLHFKFVDVLTDKVTEEMQRRQHYAGSREYSAYALHGPELTLHTPQSTRYRDWRQLCELGLMTQGEWF